MNVSVTSAYARRVAELGQKYRKYTPLFDCGNTYRFGFDLEGDGFSIWYESQDGRQTVQYPDAGLKRCEVRFDGYLLLLKDQRFVFLPVTGNANNDEYLLFIGEVFKVTYDGFRFVVVERLQITDPKSPADKKKKVGFELSDSPVAVIIVALLAVIMATFFIFMKVDFAPITAEECVSYAGVYQKYRVDGKDYIDLSFDDERVFVIHHACGSSELYEKLDAVMPGTQLELRINPNVEYVVEIRAGGRLILDMDTAQNAMLREANAFMWLGIAVYAMAAFLLVYAVYKLCKERKRRAQ